MKKLLLLSAIAWGIATRINAQTNTFPASGNVGIGTTSPQAKLDVAGVAQASQFIIKDNFDNVLRSDENGNTYHLIGTYRGWDTKAVYIAGYNAGNSAGIATTERVYIGNPSLGGNYLSINLMDGNVGIGTISPQAKLHIEGDCYIKTDFDEVLTFDNTDNSWQYMQFKGNGVRKTWMGIDPDNNFNIYKETGGAILFGGSNVGIGTTSPQAKLDVAGVAQASQFIIKDNFDNVLRSDENGNTYHLIGTYRGWDTKAVYIAGYNAGNSAGIATTERVYIGNPSLGGNYLSINLMDGNVGIGTTTPGSYKLAVEGTIGARKVKVTTASWADYVFEKDYHLPTLAEVEKYIQQHKHLPDVPSAAEIEKDGLDLGDNQAVLLKKIEELTLYAIDQHKRQADQDEKIEEQNKKIEILEVENKAFKILQNEVEKIKIERDGFIKNKSN